MTDAGNSLAAARELNLTANSQTFTDFVGTSDPNDFYRFTFSSRSSFNLTLDGLTANANVELLREDGSYITGSFRSGTTTESIRRVLNAGNYFIRVIPTSGANTNYNLNVSAVFADNAGNNLGNARDIGSVTGTQKIFRDAVGNFDTNDFYRLTVNPSSNLSLRLDGLSADADLIVLDSAGTVVASAETEGTVAEVVNLSTDTIRSRGTTYYVRVLQFSGNTNYNLTVSGSQPDFAGNALSTARQLGALNGSRSIEDFVGNGDSDDFYSFSIAPNSSLSLRLSDLTSDADLELFNSAGTVIGSSLLSGNSTDQINLSNLIPGTYFARVFQANGDTNYTLNLLQSASDFAGNTTSVARNVGLLNGTRVFNDFVGSGDGNDFYRFDVTSTVNFSLSLERLSANADVELLNNFGVVLAASALGGTNSEAISGTLSAGTYFVRVLSTPGANTYYNLALASSLTPSFDTAGNSFDTALNIGSAAGGNIFRDGVGSFDTADFYRLSVNPFANLGLRLDGLSADADLTVFDAMGTVVATSESEGNVAEEIFLSTDVLTARGVVYFVRVNQFSGDTNYNLSISTTPIDFANNSQVAARDLGPVNGSITVQDTVFDFDTEDFYRFNVSPGSNLNIRLDGLSADADLEILNFAGEVVADSATDGVVNEEITLNNLDAGVYFARVVQFRGTVNYNLTLSTSQTDFAGDGIGTARNLGVLNGFQSFTDFIGGGDNNDFYRFELKGTSNFSLSLGGLTGDTNVQLLDSNGVAIASSASEGTNAEFITRSLTAGTYFVRVLPFDNSSSFYNLNFLA